jgi:hypothetical protein
MSRTTLEVVTDMLIDFKEITGIELSASDLNRDEVISLYPFAGVISALESKIEQVEDNFHPSTSDESGLIKHLASNELPDQIQPQKSQGRIKHTGVDGTIVSVGNTVKRKLDGKIFVCIQDGIISGGQVTCSYESLTTGQENNIDSLNVELAQVNAIAGVDNSCFSTTRFLNGRDLETPGEMLQRIQDKVRRVDTGGNLAAYERMAKEASPLVVTATAVKHPRGVSTVNTIITSGTTDIDTAVNSGQDVTRSPSSDLLTAVQAYILSKCPTTDDHLTLGPAELNFNSTLILALYDESLRSTVSAAITKIWKIFVYKAKPNQRIYPTDIEKLIDASLGHLIKFRRIQDFTVDHYYDVPSNSVLVPVTLTISNP